MTPSTSETSDPGRDPVKKGVEKAGKRGPKDARGGSRKKKSGINEAEAEIAATREEFAATLDAIEDKLNPRTQLRRARGAISKLVSRSKE